MANLQKDSNSVAVSGGVSDLDGVTILPLKVNSVTGRLMVSAINSTVGTPILEEVPTDSGDHTNFTIAHTPIASSFRLYRGGARQSALGSTPDYVLTGAALVLTVALATGESLIADYNY